MAPRGPKTMPTNLKLLTGTARAHRLNPQEPLPDVATPDAPEHLTEAALAEWDRIVLELFAMKLLTNLDRAALAAYCQAYGRWSSAETALARMAAHDAVTDGLIVKTKSGNLIQNPLVGAANKAMADMVRYAAEFGLTPSARTRVAGVMSDADPYGDCAEWLA
jgi:P27 family predicted phage terminase small subunit